jgi:hypothetical protein
MPFFIIKKSVKFQLKSLTPNHSRKLSGLITHNKEIKFGFQIHPITIGFKIQNSKFIR